MYNLLVHDPGAHKRFLVVEQHIEAILGCAWGRGLRGISWRRGGKGVFVRVHPTGREGGAACPRRGARPGSTAALPLAPPRLGEELEAVADGPDLVSPHLRGLLRMDEKDRRRDVVPQFVSDERHAACCAQTTRAEGVMHFQRLSSKNHYIRNVLRLWGAEIIIYVTSG